MKLKSISIHFIGPCSPELFQVQKLSCYKLQGDYLIYGSGMSKAEASIDTVAKLGDHITCRDEIISCIQAALPSVPEIIEGDQQCSVYCLVDFSVEEE